MAKKNKKNGRCLWKHFVTLWENFYRAHYKEGQYGFRNRDIKRLANIYDRLKTKLSLTGFLWNTVNATAAFNGLLNAAYSSDPWLQNNFTLANIHERLATNIPFFSL